MQKHKTKEVRVVIIHAVSNNMIQTEKNNFNTVETL